MSEITNEAYDRYLTHIKPDVNAMTYKSYATCINVFRKWMHTNSIDCPTTSDIMRYKQYIEDCGLAATTRGVYMRIIKAFFNWASNAGIYPDVAVDIKIDYADPFDHYRDVLDSSEDVQAIAEKIDTSTLTGKRLYAIFLLCIACGLRMIEISRARMQDLRIENGRMYLYVWGKGHDKPDTPILLPNDVIIAIGGYLTELDSYYFFPGAPLFASTSNSSKGKRIAPTTISTQLKTAIKNAGYDSDRITAHSLRHTSATLLFNATHDIRLVQQHLRHKNPASVAIYIHNNEQYLGDTSVAVIDYLNRQMMEEVE